MSDTVPKHEYKGGDIKLLSLDKYNRLLEFVKYIAFPIEENYPEGDQARKFLKEIGEL